MNLKKVLLPVFILSATLSFALDNSSDKNKINGYNITIETKNLAGKTLRLMIYNGSFKNPIQLDSIKITDENQKVVFTREKEILLIPAAIEISNSVKSRSFLMLRNSVATGGTIDGAKSETITWNDVFDKKFKKYLSTNDSIGKAKLTGELLNLYPSKALAMYLNMNNRLNWKNNENSPLFIDKYLKDIDLESKNIVAYPTTYQFINNLFENINYEDGIIALLGKNQCDKKNYPFYFNWVIKNLMFRYERGEDVKSKIDFLYSDIINKGNCKKTYSEFLDKTVDAIKSSENFPKHSPFTNFYFEDVNGNTGDLQTYLKNNPKPTVIVFYDPDCSHCKLDVPKTVKQMNELEKQYGKKFNKIAVMYFGEDKEWKYFIKGAGLSDWLNVKSQPGQDDIYKVIQIAGTPSYFILNSKGETLSDRFDEDELVNNGVE